MAFTPPNLSKLSVDELLSLSQQVNKELALRFLALENEKGACKLSLPLITYSAVYIYIYIWSVVTCITLISICAVLMTDRGEGEG